MFSKYGPLSASPRIQKSQNVSSAGHGVGDPVHDIPRGTVMNINGA